MLYKYDCIIKIQTRLFYFVSPNDGISEMRQILSYPIEYPNNDTNTFVSNYIMQLCISDYFTNDTKFEPNCITYIASNCITN